MAQRKRTEAEKKRHAAARELVKKDFPPSKSPKLQPVKSGVGADIRAAREAQGLTWYAFAKMAGVPNPATIRDIEYGRDAKLSNVAKIVDALGLSLQAVWGVFGGETMTVSAQQQGSCAVVGHRPDRSEPRENKRRPKVLKLMIVPRKLYHAARASMSKTPQIAADNAIRGWYYLSDSFSKQLVLRTPAACMD